MSVKTEIEKTKLQVQGVDQTTHPPKCHSFVGLDRQIGSSPPALLEGEKKEERKKGEVLHLFRCYTYIYIIYYIMVFAYLPTAWDANASSSPIPPKDTLRNHGFVSFV